MDMQIFFSDSEYPFSYCTVKTEQNLEMSTVPPEAPMTATAVLLMEEVERLLYCKNGELKF